MKYPKAELFDHPGSARNDAMEVLRKTINADLKTHFTESRDKGDQYLAGTLLGKVGSIIDELNRHGYHFGRLDYAPDIRYEKSEQWYSNGKLMGSGIFLHFKGYQCQVSWRDTIDPCNEDAFPRNAFVEDVTQKIDNLTKLPTIGWIRDHWREFANALPKTNALLYFDVDTLYCVKDLFGMEESDNRLVFTADTIRENVAQEFPVVRFAGDEFLALVDNGKFTEHDLKKLIKLLDDPSYKINVNYSSINHFSVSGCMLKTGEIDSFEKLDSLADKAIEVIRQKKSPTEFRKYEFQSVMVAEDAT